MYLSHIKNFLILFLLLNLTSCMGVGPAAPYGPPPYTQNSQGQNPNLYTQQFPSAGQQTPYLPPPRSDLEYERRKIEDEDRDEVLDSSRRRNRGNTCKDKDTDHECRVQCKTMYKRGADRKDCEKLTVTQIEKLLDVYEILEEADGDDLEEIDQEDFEVYLNVSIAGFDRLAGRYSRNETRDVLIWIIENEEITDHLQDEDDDYRTLTELFQGLVGNFGDDSIYKPFTRNIDRNDTLIEVAIESANENALYWFQEYIEEEGCNDEISNINCFQLFCKIGDEMDKNNREDWLEYAFGEYIEEYIIEAGVNSIGRNSDGVYSWTHENPTDEDHVIEELSDLEDWVDDLCKGKADLT